MKWEIDKVTKHLDLEDHYFISFDRLTEDDWFSHLAEKEWVNMKELLPAFVAAYDAAGLKLDKNFFARYKKAFFKRAEDDYVVSINDAWNRNCHVLTPMHGVGEKLVVNIFRPSELCIDDLISHKELVNA